MSMLRVIATLLAAVCMTQPTPASPQAQAKFPARLDTYLTKVLTPDQRGRLLAGQPVTKLLDTDPSREVAVLGAIWIKAPIARYVAAVTDIEQLERGEKLPRHEEDQQSAADRGLRGVEAASRRRCRSQDCRVGSCELKLGEDALNRMRKAIDWSKSSATADAEQLARQLMLEYASGYLEGGNARLAVYRDSGRPTFVAQEFTSMIERMPELSDYLPNLKRYLLDCKATLPKSDPFFTGKKPSSG